MGVKSPMIYSELCMRLFAKMAKSERDGSGIYRVDQKSKLLILSEHVNKTEKIRGTRTKYEFTE